MLGKLNYSCLLCLLFSNFYSMIMFNISVFQELLKGAGMTVGGWTTSQNLKSRGGAFLGTGEYGLSLKTFCYFTWLKDSYHVKNS